MAEHSDGRLASGVEAASDQVRAAIAPRTRLRVAKGLGIADADPIVDVFAKMQARGHPSSKSKDLEAHFIASAPKIFEQLSPKDRQRCGRADDDPADIKPRDVRARPELRALNAQQVRADRNGGLS